MIAKKTILIVEDDLAISVSIRELLEDSGYEVLSAGNGAEALALLKNVTRPAVILLDLMMPVMDGFKFRENQLLDDAIKNIPVIVMSADGHVQEKKIRMTAQDYLRKPIDIFVLLSAVEKFAI